MYRTNAQSRAMEEAFIRANLPYVLVGGTRFYERREVKDVVAYLRLLVNPSDGLTLRRVINVPPRKIGATTLPALGRWADANGATLMLKFVLPDVVVQKLGPVTLSAKIGSTTLTPEKFSTAGEQIYSRPVPAEALKADAVTVEFALDKALPPTGEDIRQLGVIVNMVGFEVKQP